ncbi:Hercynine oxygenase [bacterium HR37]|nr:Hercynine oxygenase [bacterium HR37]
MHPKTTLDLLAKRYCEIRIFTEALCQPLATEDYVVQSIPYVSPTKWHLAHTSWFFETFLLSKDPSYKPLNPAYSYLFNSYYLQIGKRHCRPKRGLLSRPTVKDIYAYRKHVDKHITELLERASEEKTKEIIPIVEIGLQHEQQHQELILTDIKHVFSANPLRPVYTEPKGPAKSNAVSRIEWIPFKEGLYWIGHSSILSWLIDWKL